jgi:hypothetical protein
METPVDPKLAAAVKHYEAMRRAQKKYYEKKAGPVEERRKPGRPRKEVAEGRGTSPLHGGGGGGA